MRKLCSVAALALVGLASCSAPGAQSAVVTMQPGICDVQTADLQPGAIEFTIRNDTTSELKFYLTENRDEAVASATVAPGATTQITATLDSDDEYHTACGDVPGPVLFAN